MQKRKYQLNSNEMSHKRKRNTVFLKVQSPQQQIISNDFEIEPEDTEIMPISMDCKNGFNHNTISTSTSEYMQTGSIHSQSQQQHPLNSIRKQCILPATSKPQVTSCAPIPNPSNKGKEIIICSPRSLNFPPALVLPCPQNAQNFPVQQVQLLPMTASRPSATVSDQQFSQILNSIRHYQSIASISKPASSTTNSCQPPSLQTVPIPDECPSTPQDATNSKEDSDKFCRVCLEEKSPTDLISIFNTQLYSSPNIIDIPLALKTMLQINEETIQGEKECEKIPSSREIRKPMVCVDRPKSKLAKSKESETLNIVVSAGGDSVIATTVSASALNSKRAEVRNKNEGCRACCKIIPMKFRLNEEHQIQTMEEVIAAINLWTTFRLLTESDYFCRNCCTGIDILYKNRSIFTASLSDIKNNACKTEYQGILGDISIDNYHQQTCLNCGSEEKPFSLNEKLSKSGRRCSITYMDAIDKLGWRETWKRSLDLDNTMMYICRDCSSAVEKCFTARKKITFLLTTFRKNVQSLK